jgi:hypothetical protein
VTSDAAKSDAARGVLVRGAGTRDERRSVIAEHAGAALVCPRMDLVCVFRGFLGKSLRARRCELYRGNNSTCALYLGFRFGH